MITLKVCIFSQRFSCKIIKKFTNLCKLVQVMTIFIPLVNISVKHKDTSMRTILVSEIHVISQRNQMKRTVSVW